MLEAINGWQTWTSDRQFKTVKSELTSFIFSFQKELIQASEQHRAEVEKLEKEHEQKLALLHKMLLDDPIEAAKLERMSLYRTATAPWKDPNGAARLRSLSQLSGKIEYRAGEGFWDRQKIKRAKKRNAATMSHLHNELDRLNAEAQTVERIQSELSRRADDVLAAKTALYNKKYSDASRQENEQFDRKLELATQQYTNARESIINRYQTDFAREFNSATLRTAVGAAASLMRESTGYTVCSDVPQAMFFGNRSFTVCAETVFEDGVISMLRSAPTEHFLLADDCTSVRITLPYCRTIKEGYSIFLISREPQSAVVNEMIRSYTMKILMNFPAGQLRPVLFDNESTTTFSLFSEIGDGSGRGITTRPWDKPADIEAELDKLTTEHHQLVNSYGEDIASRMSREPIYYVACRNFPKGISEKALRDMEVVWLAGSDSGFFGMVTANEGELSKIKDKEPLGGMMSKSLQLKEVDGICYFETPGPNAETLSFDLIPNVMRDPEQILRVITSGYGNYHRQIEKFEYLFSRDSSNLEQIDANDINTWMRGDASKNCEIPIGIFGARTVQKLSIDGTRQHALISGVTGSGKSSLLRTFILAAMIKYDPDNVNFYLIDFKEGVEFAPFTKYHLPWIKMIALNTEREFARKILRELLQEFNSRASAMARESVSSVGTSRENRFPRIFFIFDEIQELLRTNDEISQECIAILATLVSEGRAMNINVILASQDFTQCSGMNQLMPNMVIRIAFGGNSESAKFLLGSDYLTSQLDQGESGFAAINTAGGAKNQTTLFQVGYLPSEERDKLLRLLSIRFSSYPAQTRILSRRASMDINNRFNRLILEGVFENAETPDAYDLMIGEFSMIRRRYITISPKKGENILIIGNTENNAKAICSLGIMSFLYDELAANARLLDNELVRIVDLSDQDSFDFEHFEQLRSFFPQQISRVELSGLDAMIDDTYKNIRKRQRGELDKTERVFLILFGIDGALSLQQEMYSNAEDDSSLSTAQKISVILQHGPEVGVNSIIWCRSLPTLKRIVENSIINSAIYKRIFYGNDKNQSCEELTGVEAESSVVAGAMAQYKNRQESSTSLLRLYELPEPEWIEQYAKKYAEIINERKGN